jgi:hypothetical protein
MISIPVSVGELLDKLSILRIKTIKIQNPEKLEKVTHEYELLHELSQNYLGVKEYFNLYDDLIATNSKLWEIEDKLRVLEKQKIFNEEFIELARKVYYTNDERFEIKNKIKLLLDSEIQEQKSYEDYKN